MTTQTDLTALQAALATAQSQITTAASAAATAEQQVAAGTPSIWASIATMFDVANAQKAVTAAQAAASALAVDIQPPPPPPPRLRRSHYLVSIPRPTRRPGSILSLRRLA